MTTLVRTLAIAEMQGRELIRRRVAMALFMLLPAAFFYSIPPDEEYGLIAGAIGVSWAVAAAGLFSILGWRRVDPRLGIVGARPRDGLIGRVVLAQALALLLVAVYAPLILTRTTVSVDAGTYVLALLLLGTVSVPLGLVIGTLLPRELEGTLVLIGIIGVESSIPPGTSWSAVFPLYGPLEVLASAAGFAESSVREGVVHAVVTIVVLTLVAYLLWRRRVRVFT
jgi:hypothetical protein